MIYGTKYKEKNDPETSFHWDRVSGGIAAFKDINRAYRHAASISCYDWLILELDETEAYVLFDREG